MEKQVDVKGYLSADDVAANVRKAIEHYIDVNKADPKDKDIALALHISPAAFSKKMSGKSQFSIYEVRALSDFLGVSCDTLLSVPTDSDKEADSSKAAALRLPITEDVLKYITDMQSSFPEGFEMLNLILENDLQICERLLRIFLYYSFDIMLKVTTLSASRTTINPDSTKRMIKSLALSDLSFLLDDVSKIWNSSERYEKNAELEKQMRKNRVPEKERRRMRAKSNMTRGQINAIEFINIVEQLASQESSYLNPWGYDDKFDFEEYKEEDDNTVAQTIQNN